MALNSRVFLGLFPEFEPATPIMVKGAIDRAIRAIDSKVYGTQTDDAVGWLAAHYLAVSPFGIQARLVAKDGTTTYHTEYEKITRARAIPIMVI